MSVQAYLSALGIDSWTAWRPLPGAGLSREISFPSDTDKEPPVVSEVKTEPEKKSRSETVSQMASVRAEVEERMPETVKPTVAQEAEVSIRSQVVETVYNIELFLGSSERFLVVAEAVELHRMSMAKKLLSSILATFPAEVSEPVPFFWPPFSHSRMPGLGKEGVSRTLHKLIEESKGVDGSVIHFGCDPAVRSVVTDLAQLWRPDLDISNSLVEMPSLKEMLENSLSKKQAWQIIKQKVIG